MDHDADVQVLDQLPITEFPLPQTLFGPLALGHFLTQACVRRGQRLGPVADDLFQLLIGLLQALLGGAAAGDYGRHRQPRQRVQVHEHLQMEQRLLQGLRSERPPVGPRTADRGTREERGGQGDFGKFKSQADPDQEDQGDIQQMVRNPLGEPAAENGLTGQDHRANSIASSAHREPLHAVWLGLA